MMTTTTTTTLKAESLKSSINDKHTNSAMTFLGMEGDKKN